MNYLAWTALLVTLSATTPPALRADDPVIVASPTDVRVVRIANRGYLGVEVVGMTPELRTHFGVDQDAGVLVSRVDDDSPAAVAGLEVGDLVLDVDGAPIASFVDLKREIGRRKSGEQVELGISRDGSELTLVASLEERAPAVVDIGRLAGGPGLWEIDEKTWAEYGEALARRIEDLDLEAIGVQIGEVMEGVEWEELGEEIEAAIGSAMSTLESPEFEARIRHLGRSEEELEGRLRELEARLEELEEELDQR